MEKERNCWLVKLKPGGENGNKEVVKELQEICIRDKIFGMGWPVSDMYSKNGEKVSIQEYDENNEEKFNKEKLDYYKKKLENKYLKKEKKEYEKSSVKKAFDYYKQINVGDYVMTRLGDGKYYIGICKGDICYYTGKNKILKDNFSWYGKVEEWIEINEDDVPGHIYGYFSFKNQSTIRRVSKENEVARELIENTYKFLKKENFKKIDIDKYNFNKTLYATDLEDLVYCYILNQEENQGYILYPSKSKISTVKYEFYLINIEDENKKMITCQVKNDAEVLYKNYIDDKNKFEGIYLFSGIEKYTKDKKCDMKELIEKLKKENMYIIDKEKLYVFLIENDNPILKALKKRISKYFKLI